MVEVLLKVDLRGVPSITKESLAALEILTEAEYETLKDLAKQIAYIVREELQKKGIELYDIKFEFGRIGKEKTIALIDEISAGNMRAYKNGKYLQPLTLAELVLDG